MTRIKWGTFAGCSNLSSITIPNSVSIIEGGCWGGSSDGTEFYNRGTFEDCYRLTSISLPQGVTSIGDEAFKNCNISNIKVPITNFTAFCENKVIECIYHSIGKPIQLIDNEEKEIKEYVVPESVASIGNRAFINCDGLTAMTIAGSVTSIGDYAFENCI